MTYTPVVYDYNKATDPEKWLQLRRSGIGGSDVAAICGLNPWRGPLSVYLSKVGQAPEIEQSEAMELGEFFEDTIAELFAKRTGFKVSPCGVTLRHPEHRFMLATLDKWVDDGSGDTGVLEVKNVGERMAKDWDDERCPDYYQLQVQHYLCVTGKQYAWVAPLIGGNRLKPIRIERNDALIDELIRMEGDFWMLVQDRRPPAVDDSSEAEKVLRYCYPKSEPGLVVQMQPEQEDTYKKLLQCREGLRLLESEERLYKNQLIEWMKDAEAAFIPGQEKPAVTYKGCTSHRLDTVRLAAECPEVAARFYVESSTRRFLVKATDNG